MIETQPKAPSLSRQCILLGIPRSSFYYQPAPESEENLKYMRLMDEMYMKHPFYGVRNMTHNLRNMGYDVNPKRIRRLMRQMNLVAVGPKPRLSQPGLKATRYPYLLRNRVITAPNEVWCTDITYIPMAKGFMYLVAVMDWYSRFVLDWELSNSLDGCFCVSTLETSLSKYGSPLIFNSDQGAQFTSQSFEACLLASDIQISRDGIGRATDNAFIERLWRSVKYECVYLTDFRDGQELFEKLESYFAFYNYERLHQGLQNAPPASFYPKSGKNDAGEKKKDNRSKK